VRSRLHRWEEAVAAEPHANLKLANQIPCPIQQLNRHSLTRAVPTGDKLLEIMIETRRPQQPDRKLSEPLFAPECE